MEVNFLSKCLPVGGPVPSDYVWHLTDKLYVISDEYVEYRKALAEGKTIQYKDREGFWNKIEYKLEEYHLEELRIKPEELKFKAGDWVRLPRLEVDYIYKVTENTVCLTHFGSIGIYTDTYQNLELWQPKPGEWCWFWNEPSDIPILAKLISIEYFLERPTEYKIKTPSYISETVYSCMTYMYFKNCEPFIGQLPTILKDSK